ncbi:uncharacterized protein LOC143185137 [Calliopsis andreniformis]|uniref:uncharacterized protein LOC143185137 n=1 Tax=Calliopsis andreniformis TaxID=337506 RepID=UPI003FCCD318
MGPLLEELLILVKEIVSIDKTMIFIGLIDVTSSVEKNITEFIMFAADATHLITPLNFFAHITKLAIEKQIPFIYVPKKEDLSQACCTVDEVSVIALKKNPFFNAFVTVLLKLNKSSKQSIP